AGEAHDEHRPVDAGELDRAHGPLTQHRRQTPGQLLLPMGLCEEMSVAPQRDHDAILPRPADIPDRPARVLTLGRRIARPPLVKGGWPGRYADQLWHQADHST